MQARLMRTHVCASGDCKFSGNIYNEVIANDTNIVRQILLTNDFSYQALPPVAKEIFITLNITEIHCSTSYKICK